MTPTEKDIEKAKEIIDYGIKGNKELYGPWDLLIKLISNTLTEVRQEEREKAKGLEEVSKDMLNALECFIDSSKKTGENSPIARYRRVLDQYRKDK